MRLERRIRSYLEQGFTLTRALCETAEAAPEAGITYVASDGGERFESYAALVKRAKRIAAALHAEGLAPGERVLLQLDDPSDAIGAFWGALFGGFVPAPLSVPSTHAADDPDHAKLRAVHAILGRPLIVGREGDAKALAASDVAPVRFASLEALAASESAPSANDARRQDDLAFLMFSSGSTGTPKGVRLTHQNLLHNARQIAERSELEPGDTTLSWLPLTHDMGLVLFHLVPALAGVKQVILAPLTFVRQPALLLRKIGEHRATITGAPNFAVDHMTRSIDDATVRALDLSTLRALFNGAEPISGAVCRDFVRKLAPAGLRSDVIHPGYGIAEACVTATQHPASRRAALGACPSLWIDRDTFLRHGRVSAVPPERAASAVEVVNLGPPMPGMEIRVVGEDGAIVPDGHVARIEVKGPNVTRGYETAADAAPIGPKDGWLATGDLGFLHDGCVYVTGREKDVLFVNGRKFYSHDIEETIVKHTSHRLGRVAVIGWRDWRDDAERVTVFFATPKKPERAAGEAAEIADLLANVLPFPIDHVLPIASLPRTTSGKIQRYALRERLVSGELDALIATVAANVDAARASSVPAGELEAAIMTACATEGAAVRLGSEASFVRLVGDSLRVAQLAAKLATSGIHPGLSHATPGMLYEHRTPRALAAFLAGGAQARPSAPITRGDLAVAELSHAQKQLWLAHQLDPASTAYSEAHFCDLAPGTDLGTLERAVRAVVGAHAALRTVFREDDNGVRQEVLEHPDVDFAVIDLRRAPVATFRATALAEARTDAASPLRLGGRVPARFRVFAGPDGRAALMMNVHHILVDGSSVSILLREIARAYSRPDKIPAWRGERLRSIDYYEAHTRLLASDARDAAAACARAILHPWPARPELPTAAHEAGDQAGTRVTALDADLSARLHAAALRHGFTPYQLCLAAFALLVNHVAEVDDVTFGTTVSGRGSAEVQELVAYIANTVAVRVDLSRLATLRSLIEAVATRSEELLRHQSIPLSALRRELDPPAAAWPPYSAVFTMMPAPEEDGLTARLFVGHEPVRIHAKTDILLAVETNKNSMRCTWEYRRGRHDERQIGEWHNRWTLILRRILDDIDAPLVESRLLTEHDRKAIAALQAPPAAPPKHLTLNGYIGETIARRPDSFAVSDPHRAITYNELNARAAHLAARLRQLGAARNTFVPIVLPKGVDMIVACVAVLRSGAAYVPIDADHPEARIAELVARSGARLVIARDDIATMLRARAEGEAPRFVSPDVVVFHPLPELADINEPDDLVYMHFTSGSTGVPKGVVNTHRSVCHLVDWYLSEGIYAVDHVIPQLPAFAFEASVGEIFPALAVGAQLHVFPSLRTLMPEQLLAELVRVGANVITITPTYLQRMLQHLDDEGRRKWPLRRVMLAGEALLVTQAREFRARLGDDVVIANAYGPTEATLHATIAELPIAIPESTGSVPIGRPFRHRRAYVVSAVGQLCPPGVVGEIWLGGEGLAAGYLGDEAKTKDAFVELRLSDRVERVYRTGDFAVLQEDGLLRFCGRRDGQVKVRGYRVEIGEVEDALRRLDAIDEAVVIPKPTGAGDTRLVAFFTSKEDARPADLVAALGRLVPTYMIPSQFVKVESMPKSTNEKIDRKQLATLIPSEAEPAPARKAIPAACAGDGDPAQRDVAEVLAEVLKAPHVGADDNFFAIGGDSIGSMDVVAKLRKRGYRVDPADVLKHGTVRELAALLASRRAKSDAPASGPAALTPSQTRHFSEGATPTPWIATIDVDGAVDADKLRAALDAVVAAHEALRVAFRRTALGVQPNVREKGDAARLVTADLRGVPAEARAAVEEKLAAEVTSQIGPKATFAAGLATREDGARVILALHPLVADAASCAIVAEDLAQAYAAIARGETEHAIAPGASYRRVAQALSDRADWDADTAWLTREHGWWARALEAAATSDLPRGTGDRARRVVLYGETLARLVKVQEDSRLAPRDVVVAAIARAIAHATARSHTALELTGDARLAAEDPDAQRVVGAFDVRYPLVVVVAGDAIATAGRVKETRAAIGLGGAGPDLLRFASGAAPDGIEVEHAPPAVRFAWRDDRPQPLAPGWTFAGAARDEARDGLAIVARADASRITIELAARNVLDDAAFDALVLTVSRELGAASEHEAVRPSFGPSDFPLARLNEAELASLPPDTEDVYPLTPMQEGMLFAVLTDGESPVYHEQVVYEYDAAIDAALLTRALEQTIARHPILRTAYRTEGVRRPVQIVRRRGTADVTSLDWRDRGERARKEQLAALLEADRAARFELAAGPLVRLIAVRTAEQQSVLVLAFHHIILDGWSQSALVAELVSRYEAERDGKPIDVAPLRGGFGDFVAKVLPLAASEESAAFWKAQMRSPTYNELPLDDARGDAPRPAAAHADLFFGVELTARLARFAADKRVSLNAVCLAGYLYLLHTLTGDADVATGVITAGRLPEIPDGDKILGCFLNTFPIRVEFDEEKVTFDELVRQTNDLLVAAKPHEHFPLKETAKLAASGAAAGARAELFSTLYAFQSYKDDAGGRAGLRVVGGHDTTNYDLAVLLFKDEQIRIVAEYAADVLSERTIHRWLRQLAHFLDVLSKNASVPIHAVDLLPDDQRALYEQYNRTDIAFETDVTMNELFERTAARTPDAIAVSARGALTHYGALNADANRIARALVQRGAKAGAFVACALHRRGPAVAALMGVLKAGAAYVPIDPRYPEERIALLVKDCDAKVLVTDRAAIREGQVRLASLPGVEHVILVDEERGGLDEFAGTTIEVIDREAWLALDPRDLPRRATPDDVAYVIYTSGSTGRPKGVVIRHFSAVNTIFGINRLYDVGPDDRVLCFSSFCFDLSVYDLFGTLAAGGEVVLATEDEIKSGEALLDLVDARAVTIWDSVPTGMSQLVQTRKLQPTSHRLTSLRLVMLSGEFIPLALPGEIRKTFPNASVSSLGGATEGTVWSIYYYPVTEVRPSWRSIPYGWPLPNQGYYVLNSAMKPCAIDQPGMLYIVGKGVAKEYFKDPEKTAASFVRDPFKNDPRAIIYKTGDLGRMKAEGHIEIIGRKDAQVKIRGYRIELGEVENQLGLHPEVKEAAVLVAQDAQGHKRMVAYFSTANDALNGEALAAYLRTKLPDYMVPSQFLRIEKMPVNNSGKIDRKRLPEMAEGARLALSTAYAAPETPVEIAIADVWKAVLAVERVGRDDNYFALGGDSILSLQIASRLAEKGFALKPSELFKHPTVARLAVVIGKSAAVAIDQGPTVGEAPLTPAQKWFFGKRFADPKHWHFSLEVEIREAVDPARLERALRALADRHDALRARFVEGDAGVVQRFEAPERGIPLEVVDLSNEAPEARARLVAEWAQNTRIGIDPAAGPIARATLLRLGAEEHRLVWAVHHLAVDVVSWRILAQELATAYAGSTLPPRSSAVGAWAERVERTLDQGDAAARLAPWADVLAAPRFALATRSAEDIEGAKAHVDVHVDPETTRALVEEANACFNTTTHDLVLAACAIAAARAAGAGSVTLDVEHHGRTLFEEAFDLSRTVGWFTSIYPFHVPVGATTPIDQVIIAVKEKGRALRGHAEAFLGLRHANEPAVREAFAGYGDQDILLNYVGSLDAGELASAWRFAENLAPDHGPSNRRTHPLDLMIAIRGGELVARLAYSEAAFSEERARAFVRELGEAVRAIVLHCLDARNHRKTRSDFPLLELDDAALARLQGDNVEDAYPLTAMQRAMGFFTELHPGSPLYHVHCVALLRADLDVALFERALNLVAEQVPILRTELSRGFKEPVQIVHRAVAYKVGFEDVRTLTPEAQVARRDAFLAECGSGDVAFAFPNMRVKILRKGEDLFELVQFFHHAFIDGWSNAGLLGQILETYVSLRENGSARVPALASTFKDYVAFERAQESNGVSAAFWAERMRGATINELPLDKPRRASRRFATEMLYFRLDPELAARVRKLARDEGGTLSELLAAAHVALIALLTGDSDVTIGYSLAARPGHIPQIHQLAGNFLNTVPLRVAVDPSATLRDVAARARESLRATREHEAYPLASIVRAAGIAGAAGGSPFRTMFTAENYPPAKFPAGIQGVDGYNWHMTEYDLAIVLTEMKVRGDADEFRDEVFLKLAFASDVLGKATVEAWFKLFESIVRALCTDPSATLASVIAPRLPAPPTPAEAPLFRDLVHGVFRRFGDKKAIAAEGRAVTYAQLEEQIERFAGAFAAAGVGAGDRVLIACQERGAFSTAAIAACLALGVTFVPSDGSLPACRLRALAEAAGVTAVITDHGERIADALGEIAPRLRAIVIPRPLPWREDQPSARFVDVASSPRADAKPPARDAVAYVIHTSGTTGAPKGIAITQDALASFLAWYEGATGIGAEDRVSQRLPMGFDAALSEILPALARGGEVRIERGLEASTPHDVLADAAAHATRVLTLPAPYFEEIGRIAEAAPPLPALRLVVVGGDRLPSAAVRAWQARYPHAEVLNVYGLTEATIASSAYRVDPNAAPDASGSVPIGHAGEGLAVLDGRFEPCKAGEVGEIWIVGPTVTVTPIPGRVFVTESGARALRTGDVGRVKDDGAIEFIGRRDAQVKVRGQRVDLDVVARAIEATGEAARAVAQVETSAEGKRLLVAYVQPRAGAPLDTLRATLAAVLPPASVPHVILAVPQIPLEPSGKTDRAALSQRFAEEAARAPAPDAEEDEVTHGLRAIWGRLVGAAAAPRHASFFEVGGDSLAAMRLVEAVRLDLGVSLPLEAVLQGGTLDDLSACVRRARDANAEDRHAR